MLDNFLFCGIQRPEFNSQSFENISRLNGANRCFLGQHHNRMIGVILVPIRLMQRLPPIIQFHLKRHQTKLVCLAIRHYAFWHLAQQQIGHAATGYRKIASE